MVSCGCAGSEHSGGQQGSQQQAAAPVGYGGYGPAGLERSHVNPHKPSPLGKCRYVVCEWPVSRHKDCCYATVKLEMQKCRLSHRLT